MCHFGWPLGLAREDYSYIKYPPPPHTHTHAYEPHGNTLLADCASNQSMEGTSHGLNKFKAAELAVESAIFDLCTCVIL